MTPEVSRVVYRWSASGCVWVGRSGPYCSASSEQAQVRVHAPALQWRLHHILHSGSTLLASQGLSTMSWSPCPIGSPVGQYLTPKKGDKYQNSCFFKNNNNPDNNVYMATCTYDFSLKGCTEMNLICHFSYTYKYRKQAFCCQRAVKIYFLFLNIYICFKIITPKQN